MREKFYVPVLKWKRGEQIGVSNLSDPIKDKIIPLIEIPEIDWDYDKNCYKKTIDTHLENTAKTILNSWGKKRHFFLDIPWAGDGIDYMTNGDYPLQYLFDTFRVKGLLGIPVVKCSSPKDYINAVKKIINIDYYGACIRIKDKDLLNLNLNLQKLLKILGLEKDKIDLIIDLEYITPSDSNKNLLFIQNILKSIPNISNWRSITMCATSFPQNTSSVSRNTTGKVERGEWTLWKNILSSKSQLKTMPNYGDYAISNPAPFKLDPKLMQMSANIRYTVNEDFLIFKGISIKKGKWSQAQNLCDKIINHPQYYGKTFSWGDTYIFNCAYGLISTGNAETWRRVGTNHHLKLVINQLSSLHEL